MIQIIRRLLKAYLFTAGSFGSGTIADASGKSQPAKLIKSTCFNTLYNASIASSRFAYAASTGVGSGDYYFRCIFKISSADLGNTQAPYVCDGITGTGAKKFMLRRGGVELLAIELSDGTNTSTRSLFSAISAALALGDWCELIFTRVGMAGNNCTVTINNLTRGNTGTETFANTYNWADAAHSLVVGTAYSGTTSDYLVPVITTDFALLQIGTAANNLGRDYTFAEGAGSKIYNRFPGNDLTIRTPSGAWANTQDYVHNNIANGFTKEATYGMSYTSTFELAALGGAYSSVKYLDNGIALAGRLSSTVASRIFRSTDYGKTWSTVGVIAGFTGASTYHFGYNPATGTVIVGTGDTGNVCLLRSTNKGANWSVVMTTDQIQTLAGTTNTTNVSAIYSAVYVGNNKWLCLVTNTENSNYIFQSTDDGATWSIGSSTGLTSYGRKLVQTSDGRLIYTGISPNPGVWVSGNGGSVWIKTGSFAAYSGICDAGSGVYYVGTWATGVSPQTVYIYKSINSGISWNQVGSVAVNSTTAYIRSIISPVPNVVIAYAGCSESSPGDRQCIMLVSTNAGASWASVGNPYTNANGGMNAVYDSDIVEDGVVIAACQPDANLIRSYVPGIRYPSMNEAPSVDVNGYPVTRSAGNFHNDAETHIDFTAGGANAGIVAADLSLSDYAFGASSTKLSKVVGSKDGIAYLEANYLIKS